MQNSILKKVLIFFLIIYSSIIYSQPITHTISYPSCGLSTSLCNCLNVATSRVIGGYTHYPVCGGVKFDGTNLNLQTQYGNTISTNMGTAYAFAFPFKAFYSYTLKIDAYGTDGSGNNVNFPELQISILNALPDPNITNPGPCGPVDENSWAGLLSGIWNDTYIGPTLTTYSFIGLARTYIPNSTATRYITVLAKNGSSSLNAAYINKITIIETPPTPTFTLSPASITKACGTAISQTFTVSNVYNSSGVTGYTWNVGATNSGWYYNGAPVSGTITTTTPTLTLTSPANGVTSLSNVTASAQIGGTSYVTNACVVTNTIPSFSITGATNGTICYGANATLSTTSGGSVNWTQSSYFATLPLSCTSCASTVVTNNSSLSGVSVTLTATNSCSSASKVINLGAPSTPQLTTSSAINVKRYPAYSVASIAIVNPDANATYTWKVNGGIVQSGSYYPNYTLTLQNCPANAVFIDYNISVTATNGCGTSSEACNVYRYNCSQGTLAFQSYCNISISGNNPITSLIADSLNQVTTEKTLIYPNPTNGAFKVKLPNYNNGSTVIKVYDIVGNLVLKQSTKQGTSSVSFTQPLAKGVYTVQIINSVQKKVDIQKLVVD